MSVSVLSAGGGAGGADFAALPRAPAPGAARVEFGVGATDPRVEHKDLHALSVVGDVLVLVVEREVGLVDPVDAPGRPGLDGAGVDLQRGLGLDDLGGMRNQ